MPVLGNAAPGSSNQLTPTTPTSGVLGSMNLGSMGGLASLLGGLFGNSGAPYGDAMKQLQQYFQGAQGFQNPFYNAGVQGTQNYQNWLGTMQDPTKFINNIMGQYKESPFAQYEQQQGMRAAQNMGSATGLTGSTPLMQQAQQNAQNISSQDMNQWLGNVLGVNTQYGQGQQNLMNTGQNAANMLTNLFSNMGNNMAGVAYGQGAGQNQDLWNMIAGGLSFLF